MHKRTFFTTILLLSVALLSACNEPPNPLIGQWRQSIPLSAQDQVIEFTPSTMRIDGRVVTVIYQFRDNRVRVSASKHEMIYEFDGPDTVHYKDEQHGKVTLVRIKQ